MIVIIDYGMGNLHSVYNALVTIGATCKISSNPDDIIDADGVILPGVGAFEDSMKNLTQRNLITPIKEAVAMKKPFLGICLGMQVLFENGEEGNGSKGLGILKGNVIKMVDSSVKIPQIGWNRLEIQRETELWNKDYLPFVYYVHSYYVSDYDEEDLVAYSEYGSMKVPGYFQKENVFAMQYHPEKSGEDGLAMLKNFKEICDDYTTSN